MIIEDPGPARCAGYIDSRWVTRVQKTLALLCTFQRRRRGVCAYMTWLVCRRGGQRMDKLLEDIEVRQARAIWQLGQGQCQCVGACQTGGAALARASASASVRASVSGRHKTVQLHLHTVVTAPGGERRR